MVRMGANMIRKFYLGLAVVFLIVRPAMGSSVVLKSHEVLLGDILEKNDEYIKINLGAGEPVIYYMDEIDKISETNFYVHPFYGVLLGYQAVKQDNIGICESGQAPGVVDRCRETYEEYINDLYLAQLKCGKIDKSVENAKILCNALKAGKCPEDS